MWFWVAMGSAGGLSWLAFLNWKGHWMAALFGWVGLVLTAIAVFVIPMFVASWLWLRLVSKTWATAKVALAFDLAIGLASALITLKVCLEPMLAVLLRT